MPKLIHRPRVRYHRNGCHGKGFYLIEFEDHKQRARAHRLLGIVEAVDEGSGFYAVISPEQLSQRWRGDYFENELRAAIKAAGDEAFSREGD